MDANSTSEESESPSFNLSNALESTESSTGSSHSSSSQKLSPRSSAWASNSDGSDSPRDVIESKDSRNSSSSGQKDKGKRSLNIDSGTRTTTNRPKIPRHSADIEPALPIDVNVMESKNAMVIAARDAPKSSVPNVLSLLKTAKGVDNKSGRDHTLALLKSMNGEAAFSLYAKRESKAAAAFTLAGCISDRYCGYTFSFVLFAFICFYSFLRYMALSFYKHVNFKRVIKFFSNLVFILLR